MTVMPTSLTLGSLRVETPVVLAPMAGITNAAYRRLCAEQGAGLYVCEMITSRGLVERDETTQRMLVFDDARAGALRAALRHRPRLRRQGDRDPLRRVRRQPHRPQLRLPGAQGHPQGRRGSAALEAALLAQILEHAVAAATPYDVPVTMKTRKGLDDDHLTYLDAGRIAQESGCAAIALHARTVAQAYSGVADWDAITALVDHVDIPVLGNGDIWEASDALRMVEQTGAAGVVVGRGCLGRPWLFRDLAAAFSGDQVGDPPEAGRGGRDDASPRRAAVRAHGRGAGLQGVPQARHLVPQGIRRRRTHATVISPGQQPVGPRGDCSPSWTPTSRSRWPSWARLAGARARRGSASYSPRAGSTTPTAPGAGCARMRPRPPEGDSEHARKVVHRFTTGSAAVL